MTYLWLFHYAMIQKLAKRRFKDFPNQMDLSAFAFLCIIFVSIFAIFVDKNWLASLYHTSPRLPLGPIFKYILMVVFVPFYIYISTKFLIKNKLRRIRRIITLRDKINQIYSIVYVCFIFGVFILGIVFIFLSFPTY